MTPSTGAVSPTERPATTGELHGWKILAPLPDPVGFGGMMAGVLDDRLVATGGSQFPEKPFWLKGQKAYSDRIFTLASPQANWAEHATRLPAPVGSAASAATSEAIYYAGGLDAKGCVHHAWMMRAERGDFVFTALPDLPRAVGYGASAIVGRRWFVIGGLDSPASKAPLKEVWSLDLDAAPTQATWRREADLPGPGVFVAAAATDGTGLYVFGGIGYDAFGNLEPSRRAARLDAATGAWKHLADMPEPRVGISSPCPIMPDHRIFLIGGYAGVFSGAPRDHPGFSAQTFYFDLTTDLFQNGPLLPHAIVADRDSPGDVGPAPMIGAPAAVWRDHVVVVSGEVRSSVRTPAVLAWAIGAAARR